MTTHAIPPAEFDQEMASTRRLIERVPDGKREWKPHEKSFSLGHLALLVGWMPSWIARTLREPHIDLAASPGYRYLSTAEIVAEFDRNVASAREALAQVTGSALDEPWSLKRGEMVLLTGPRGPTARSHLNHLIHHRGQLTVYLRLVDVPLPQVYGPTADDRGFLG